jgi:hypothetical protein
VVVAPYLESLRNMENIAELRFLRRCACCDDVLERREGVMDRVEDCLDLMPDPGRSMAES